MDIGEEQETYVIEPVEDPFKRPAPAPEREPIREPVRVPAAPEREKVPA
jgi:hypothetical protein